MKRKAEYVFLERTFGKTNAGQPQYTIEELEEASENGLIDKRVYALGGVNLENIKTAKDLGFGGAVICGDLWNRFDIHNEHDYKRLISHFEKLCKAIS